MDAAESNSFPPRQRKIDPAAAARASSASPAVRGRGCAPHARGCRRRAPAPARQNAARTARALPRDARTIRLSPRPMTGGNNGGRYPPAVRCRDRQRRNDVLQLPHVAGPLIPRQLGKRRRRQPRLRACRARSPRSSSARRGLECRPGRLAQRRNVNSDDVEAIEQVLAEASGGGLRAHVAVGCRNDAHVNLAD